MTIKGRAHAAVGNTFRSLRVRNYRLYFFGQVVSFTGNWMQLVAQGWLVLQLTGSGLALGTMTALQFAPMLVAGAWGGVIVDRLDKRRILLVTQLVAAGPPLVLGVLTARGLITMPLVYALVFVVGWIRVLDTPARQSFVMEMVGADQVSNAVSLNSTVMTTARMLGPAAAGVLISTVGIAPAFLLNGVSYAAVVFALWRMRTEELHRDAPQPRAKGQLKAGVRYVWTTPELRWPLVMLALVGTLAYNFQVILPVFAKFTFHGGPQTYGALSAVIGVGAAFGALWTASRARPTPRLLVGAALLFGTFLVAASVAPTLHLAMAALLCMGAASIAFLSTTNATLQIGSSAAMRGRVMALYSVLFLGSTPIGGPIVGYVSEHFGARFGLALGGAATLVASVIGYFGLLRTKPAPLAEVIPMRAQLFRPVESGSPGGSGEERAGGHEEVKAIARTPRPEASGSPEVIKQSPTEAVQPES